MVTKNILVCKTENHFLQLSFGVLIYSAI